MKKLAAAILCLLLICCTALAEQEMSWQQMLQIATPSPVPPYAATSTPAPTEDPNADVRFEADGSVVLTITAVGDVTIGRNVQSTSTIFQKELERQDGDINFIFHNTKQIFESDDLSIINFEGVLADSYTIPSSKKGNSFLFIASPEYAQALANNSIEVATIENNHIDDFGDQGRRDTQRALTEAGIQWADEYHPTVYHVQGLDVAILSYKTFDYYNTLFTKVPQEVEKAKKENDLVIVCFHWGAEKDYAPNANQQKLGHMAVDAGADLVIGHHSHRINPIEKYNGKYIVYSVGNFSFAGNNKPDDMSTFIFQTRFRIKDGEITANPFRIIPCRISSRTDRNDFAPTPYTESMQINNTIKIMTDNGKKLQYAVSDYPLDWE